MVTSTGNIYAFGDAPYLGGPGHGTVTSAVASPDGNGYWILLSDGGVSAYGDATNFGSPPSANFNGLDPATTIFATSDSGGYWVSSAAGAVFNFGDAPNDGGMSQTHQWAHHRRDRVLSSSWCPVVEHSVAWTRSAWVQPLLWRKCHG